MHRCSINDSLPCVAVPCFLRRLYAFFTLLGMGYHAPTFNPFDIIRLRFNQSIKLYIYTAPIKVRLLTGASYKYARSNKTVFNNCLNCSREVSSLFKLSGRLFHTVGAETRKLLGPKRTVRVREMMHLFAPWLDALGEHTDCHSTTRVWGTVRHMTDCRRFKSVIWIFQVSFRCKNCFWRVK